MFSAAEIGYNSIAFDHKTANKCVITWTNSGGNTYGRATVGTVSGTSITFGTAASFNEEVTYYTDVAFDPNTANKCVIVYRDASNANYGTSILGTTSGTSISFGSEVVFYSAAASYESIDFDPNTTGKFAIAYGVAGTGYPHVSVGTLSGNSISFGSPVAVISKDASSLSLSFDSNAAAAGKFVVTGHTYASSLHKGEAILGQIGTSLTNLTSTNLIGISAAAASSGANYGRVILGQIASATTTQTTNLTSTNLIGIAAAAASSGATAKINTWGGINEAQSSLTIASDYYVQTDGTITTATGGQKVGQAISATTINMRNQP